MTAYDELLMTYLQRLFSSFDTMGALSCESAPMLDIAFYARNGICCPYAGQPSLSGLFLWAADYSTSLRSSSAEMLNSLARASRLEVLGSERPCSHLETA